MRHEALPATACPRVTPCPLDRAQPLAAILTLVPAGESAEVFLCLAASAETLFEHPLAEAILKAASVRAHAPQLSTLTEFTARPGRGVKASVDGHAVLVGTQRFLSEEGIDTTPLKPLVNHVQA